MHFLKQAPAAPLSALVLGYWFIQDLKGAYAGHPIQTSPSPTAVVTLNFGRPCTSDFAAGAPRASLLGIQSRRREWRSGEGCAFVMVMLKPAGLARLFPASGRHTGDDLLELGSVLGDGQTRWLLEDLSAAWEPRQVAARLDAWLLGRLASTKPLPETERLARAWDVLLRTSRVEAAARAVDVSTRQLERGFQEHAGHSPRQLLALERIHTSLLAAQTGQGDPLEGFSDQAHRIRMWRRYLGLTPGRFERTQRSMMADYFNPRREDAAAALAHFL
ncbi:helix-turn-helix domain-containing protein [Corallococcus aberystwythensis]|uniref:AraC family transcriptional regulator n=1 Tax=Corallococcus aberystwythensis TaxID=2316722 RepID=A0A3A8Q431_9BACT|nr:helix-turn-helix domain-containing protein [Corallococcus aberystwythensis]RKH58104.1 AraC family transcriptional regulator [Corallococcus aberystwythensis]